MDPSLDQLEAFLTVTEAGSFSGAARRLHRVQSAVSYTIGRLEEELGLSLFDRSTRRPTLTAAGQALLPRARRVLDAQRDLTASARSLALGQEPSVTLAVDSLLPLAALVDVGHRMLETYPEVSLAVKTEAVGGVARLLSDGVADLGVSGPVGLPARGLVVTHLVDVELIPVAAPGHALAARAGPVPLTAFEGAIQIVLSSRDPTIDDGVDHRVLSRQTWRVAELAAKHELLRSGLGWGTMPRHLVDEDLQRGLLRRLVPEPWGAAPIRLALSLVRRQDRPPGPVRAWLGEILRASCAGVVAVSDQA